MWIVRCDDLQWSSEQKPESSVVEQERRVVQMQHWWTPSVAEHVGAFAASATPSPAKYYIEASTKGNDGR